MAAETSSRSFIYLWESSPGPDPAGGCEPARQPDLVGLRFSCIIRYLLRFKVFMHFGFV